VSARPPSLTASADPARAMPEGRDEREWAIEAALQSLERERCRLAAMGFELALGRCREQRRFWEFVRAIHALHGTGARRDFRRIA